MSDDATPLQRSLCIRLEEAVLQGELALPGTAEGLVLFAHGSGSSRFSPRNGQVARSLNARGLGTLLFDLMTAEEEDVDLRTRGLRFDIEFLAARVIDAVEWVSAFPATQRTMLSPELSL